MREAVGSSLMLYLIIPIIILFIVFIGFIMNYASAYRAANYIITQIENCQGQMDNCNGTTWDSVTKTIKSKYAYSAPKGEEIYRCYIENGSNSYVFRVSLPVSFELPILGVMKPMNVVTETKTIVSVPKSSLPRDKCS